MTNKFLLPIQNFNAGENVILPNMILLYGPKGCGKTLFSKALADESMCNVIDIELTLDTEQDYSSLKKAVQKAKECYSKYGVYSIIQIDEIDGFLSDNTYEPQKLQEIVDSLSDNYCTVIATTNYPQLINSNIVPKSKYEKIYIEPPIQKNFLKVLKYYIEDFAESKVDYQSLVKIAQSNTGRCLYSNAKIEKEIFDGMVNSLTQYKSVNQKYLEKILSDIEPDIS